MADQPNFLLGKGERLTEPVVMAGRKVDRGSGLLQRSGSTLGGAGVHSRRA